MKISVTVNGTTMLRGLIIVTPLELIQTLANRGVGEERWSLKEKALGGDQFDRKSI